MDKKFRNRFVFLMILCAGFWFLTFNNQIQSFAAPSAKPSSAAQPAANKLQSHILPLVIQDLSLKSNQVWIAIGHIGKGNLKAADYERIIVKVGGSKSTGQGQWNLAQVDPGQVLLQENGKIEFNTKLILKKADRITASISFGTWKIVKQANLNPAALTIATPLGSGPGSPKPAGPAQATRPAPPTPPPAVPRLGPVSGVTVQRTVTSSSLTRPTAPGSLTFAVPGAGQVVMAGDSLHFILRFEHSIAEGDVTVSLRRVGSTTEQATHTYRYRPIEGEWSLALGFNIPARGLVGAEDYFLHAVHAAGNTGVSPAFTIRLRGTEGLIRVLKPADRDVVFAIQNTMRINYQFTRAAARGLVHFEMFSAETKRPVFTFTNDFPGSAVDSPQPVFDFSVPLPRDLPLSNNYFIQATHSEGSGRSGTFSVAPNITGGGPEVVEDIALTDIVKDASGAIKVRARVTGARWPIWVECFPYPLGATSIILHPGDNELTLDTTPFNGAGGDCSRNYSVRLDRYNRYTEANKTNNSLDKEISFLNRNGNLTIRNNTSLDYVGIPYGSPQNVAFDHVLHYCGTEPIGVAGLVREVRQRGTVSLEPDFHPEEFDRSIRYEVWVTDFCNTLGMERRLDTVQPGQCVFIRILMVNLAYQVDSDIILYLNDPAASWPGIRNPMTVHINFGG